MPPRISADLIPNAPNLSFEIPLWDCGIKYVAGIDEAGRGALAGPVAAAAVILPANQGITNNLHGVRDSKDMTPLKRSYWAQHLREMTLAWSVGVASQFEIDTQGILPATRLAAQRALDTLTIQPDHILLDYLFLPNCSIPQTSLIKGDTRSLNIASASILAKTTRDAMLCELEERYPGYGFNYHKGYGTRAHLQALANLGPTAAHRRSFQPIAELCNQTNKE